MFITTRLMPKDWSVENSCSRWAGSIPHTPYTPRQSLPWAESGLSPRSPASNSRAIPLVRMRRLVAWCECFMSSLPLAASDSLAQEVRPSRRQSSKPHAPRPVTGSPPRVRSQPSRELIPRRYVRHAPSERPDEPELTPVKGIDDETIHEHADEARRHHADQ